MASRSAVRVGELAEWRRPGGGKPSAVRVCGVGAATASVERVPGVERQVPYRDLRPLGRTSL